MSSALNDKKASILIADDDEPIRRRLAEYISAKYTCATARDAEEATRLLAAQRFKLLITDLRMPGASGLDLCRVVKRLSPETVVMVMAERVDVGCAPEAMRQGAYEFVLKPFDLSRLMMFIEHALRRQIVLAAELQYEQALQPPIEFRPGDSHAQDDDLAMEALYTDYHATLQALTGALSARDVETRGHSGRVVAYCLRLGAEMGLNESELIALQQGALLHDIGKIGVPDAILLKPGSLTDCERTRMCEHVLQGLRIIDGIDTLTAARTVVGQHHEQFDGSGYPDGLRGESIDITARIFAVVDAFDAITSNRPYRLAAPYAEARDEIVAHSGTQFDPQVVEAFLTILESEWDGLRKAAESQEYVEQVIGRRQICSFIASQKRAAEITTPLDVSSAAISLPNRHASVPRSAQ